MRPTLWSFLGLMALMMGCADPDNTIYPASDDLKAAWKSATQLAAEHHMMLAPADEPGQRLIVLGRLVRLEDGQFIPNHPIQAYQAGTDGSYDEAVPGDETTARLNSTVTTDSLGRFLISTVLPGDYGSSSENRHIHTSVTGADPEGYDYFFRQYMTWGLLRWANRSDQAMVLDLYYKSDTLVAAGDLVVKRFAAP